MILRATISVWNIARVTSLGACQDLEDKRSRPLIYPARLARARATDREPQPWPKCLALRAKPCRRLLRCRRLADIDHQQRLAVAAGELGRERRAARRSHGARIDDDQHGISVPHVPFGALGGVGKRRLAQLRIARKQPRRVRTVLGPAALGAPAAIGNATLN